MARPFQEPTLPSGVAPALLRFARGRGASVRELAATFELPLDAVDADDLALSPLALRSLFEAVAEACGEPWVGLRLAAEPPVSRAYAPLELTVRSSRTVADALDCFVRYATLLHPQIRTEKVAVGDSVRWVQTTPTAPRGIGRHAEEYGLAFVLARCREAIAAEALAVQSLWFAHARPRDITPLERFFGTRTISFGAESSGFCLEPSGLEALLATHDPRLLATALDLAAGALARQPAVARLSQRVVESLPSLLAGEATLEAMARLLAMSERTLQRRLGEEGTTFLGILDDVREARARALLRDANRSLLDVAEQLGFSDLATFSRAFKRWTGQPPGMFRRRGAGGLG